MRVSLVPTLVLALLGLTACRDAKIETYRVASEKPEPLPPILTGGLDTPPAAGAPNPMGGGAMANTAVSTANTGPALTWTAPEHWQANPASAMRKGSYAVPGEGGAQADFSVTAFPGDVGGEVANFNRWRGQIGLSPLPASDYENTVTRFEHDGLRFAVVEFANPDSQPAQRMIGAIVPLGQATWFFKLAGPDALVAKEKPALLDLLRSVKVSAPAQP